MKRQTISYTGGTSAPIALSSTLLITQITFDGFTTSSPTVVQIRPYGSTTYETLVLDAGHKSFTLSPASIDSMIISGVAAGTYSIIVQQFIWAK